MDPSTTLADTSPGQRIIRKIMADFVPWLTEAQEAIREGLVHGQGKPRDWNFLILLLPPEHLAYLTLRSVMSDRPCDANMLKRTLTSCVRSLVASIEQEVAFRSWVDEERSNKREARQLGKPYRDLYEALRRSTKTINSRTFRRWMTRINRLWRQGWSEEDRMQLGCALVEYLIDHSGGYFEKVISRHSGKTQTYVVLSPAAREIISDQHARAEVMNPSRWPMLCQPKPWKWEQPACPMTVDTTSSLSNSSAPASTSIPAT
jgi:DNA-directed RNA polymerase